LLDNTQFTKTLFSSLTIFAKNTHSSSNVVLTHCHSVTYCNGPKPHWRGNAKNVKEPIILWYYFFL